MTDIEAVSAPAGEAPAAEAQEAAVKAEGEGALDAPPNQTLYLRNLNEKLKIDALKRGLHAMFSQFGAIEDIVAMKRYKTRGQAWIVFSTVEAATTALHKMQGFPFYDKPMVRGAAGPRGALWAGPRVRRRASRDCAAQDIHFAKTKSDAIAKKDGTFRPREKRARAAKQEEAPAAKRQAQAAPKPAAPSAPKPDLSAPPNKILFVQNVAEEVTKEMLKTAFGQCVAAQGVTPAALPPGPPSRAGAPAPVPAPGTTGSRTCGRSRGRRGSPLSSSGTRRRPAWPCRGCRASR